MKSAYHTDAEGKKVVFIDPWFDYRENARLRRLRLVAVVCGCLSLVLFVVSLLSLL